MDDDATPPVKPDAPKRARRAKPTAESREAERLARRREHIKRRVDKAPPLPAAVIAEAAPTLRHQLAIRVRVVAVLDLTVLGDPTVWPRGLSDSDLDAVLGSRTPVLVATLGHPAAIHGLIAGRWSRPMRVIGWREPAGPMPQDALAAAQGLDVTGLVTAATDLLRWPVAV